MAKAEAQSGNVVTRGVEFVGESWGELKKVHPPTRQETMQITFLVICLILLFGMFLGLADWGVGMLMQKILT